MINLNKKINAKNIDENTKHQIEDFIKSGNADSILKNANSIDKDKVLDMFQSLSKDDIKKGLEKLKSKDISIDKNKLKKFMKDK